MSWWTKHRGTVIGAVAGSFLGPVGFGIGAGLGKASDEAGGVSNLLFGKPPVAPDMTNPAPPTRNDVIQNVLNDQLAAVNRKKNQTLGTNTAGDQTASLATSTLFGM